MVGLKKQRISAIVLVIFCIVGIVFLYAGSFFTEVSEIDIIELEYNDDPTDNIIWEKQWNVSKSYIDLAGSMVPAIYVLLLLLFPPVLMIANLYYKKKAMAYVAMGGSILGFLHVIIKSLSFYEIYAGDKLRTDFRFMDMHIWKDPSVFDSFSISFYIVLISFLFMVLEAVNCIIAFEKKKERELYPKHETIAQLESDLSWLDFIIERFGEEFDVKNDSFVVAKKKFAKICPVNDSEKTFLFDVKNATAVENLIGACKRFENDSKNDKVSEWRRLERTYGIHRNICTSCRKAIRVIPCEYDGQFGRTKGKLCANCYAKKINN